MAENAADIAVLEAYLHPLAVYPDEGDYKKRLEAGREVEGKRLIAEAEAGQKEDAEAGKEPPAPAGKVAVEGRSFSGAVKARIGSLPTPGTLAFPLLAVLIMLFFIVPIKGHTRAQHLWNVLVGKEAIPRETLGGFGSQRVTTGGTGTGMPMPTVYRIPLAWGDEA